MVCATASFLGGCSVVPPGSFSTEPFIMYRLKLADRRLRVIHVEASVYGLGNKPLILRSPDGESGSPLEPINFSAKDASGAALDIREKGASWRIHGKGRDFEFSYDVVLTIEDPYSEDVRSMLTLVADDRCRILGRDVFLVPDGSFASGVLVDADLFSDQGLSSSSPSVGGRILVPEIEDLSRTMVASGAFRHLDRSIGGTALSLAIADTWSFGDEEFFDVLCRLVAEELALLGPPPEPRYLFVCDRNPVRGGARFDHYGVHYGGSMLLLLDSRIDRSALLDAPMAVIAHEFFHNWNGEALAGPDESFLWFTEGATVYCSYGILGRAGVLSPKQIEAHRRSVCSRYRSNPYRERVAIGDAGNGDLGDKHMVNLLYDGGYLAAEALDERMRAETGGERGIIDVIKCLHERSGRSGLYGERALLAAASDLGCGDLSGFLVDLIHTPSPAAFAGRLSTLE